jgi:hypothetical protein
MLIVAHSRRVERQKWFAMLKNLSSEVASSEKIARAAIYPGVSHACQKRELDARLQRPRSVVLPARSYDGFRASRERTYALMTSKPGTSA